RGPQNGARTPGTWPAPRRRPSGRRSGPRSHTRDTWRGGSGRRECPRALQKAPVGGVVGHVEVEVLEQRARLGDVALAEFLVGLRPQAPPDVTPLPLGVRAAEHVERRGPPLGEQLVGPL